MSALKEKLGSQVSALREETKFLNAQFGEQKISDVTVSQAYGGMRGVVGMVCETSEVLPDKGLIIRGRPILDLTEKLPEEIFWLLLTGETPTEAQLRNLQDEFALRSAAPDYIFNILRVMPKDSHPMAMLNTCILAMERESVFRKRYDEGMGKSAMWEAVLEDGIRLIAALPAIASAVYRVRYNKGDLIHQQPSLGWGGNFAHMLGVGAEPEVFAKFMNLFLTLHCDHEGGNVSAFTSFTVSSALADPYYAVSAGLNGLAGPLHGLANQECLAFVLAVKQRFGGIPSDEQLVAYAWEILKGDHVIPGYGHAVLRCPDPRFIAFHQFADKHISDEPLIEIVDKIYRLVPDVLRQHGKAKNPIPNVDAISGSILYHYGLTEHPYYTVLFAVSRTLGLVAQMTLNRAVGAPILRPKSVSSSWIKEHFATQVKV